MSVAQYPKRSSARRGYSPRAPKKIEAEIPDVGKEGENIFDEPLES
jgi:hypothetical protein